MTYIITALLFSWMSKLEITTKYCSLPAAETELTLLMQQASLEWVDFSPMALVEPWLELQHASMLLLDLTALLQQVRRQFVSLA